MLKIVFTGPECSGKTTLSKIIARNTDSILVEEYARKYLNNINRPYRFTDLLKIAKGQIRNEEQAMLNGENQIICDTDLQVIKIWSLVKYGRCDNWILQNQDYESYYFLCHPEIPWIHDPQRENKNNRIELFKIYKNDLVKNKKKFTILKGNIKERINIIHKTMIHLI